MTALTKLRRRLQKADKRIERNVREFYRRLNDEPGYADTVANLVACGVELCCRERRVLGVVREATQAVAVIVRAAIRT